MPPKSERDEVLGSLTSRIFSAMLEELVMDATLQSHQELAKARTTCPTCNTKCSAVHTPASLATALATGAITNETKADTPSSVGGSDVPKPSQNNGNGTNGTSTPTNTKEGNLYLECVSCQRQIASTRYAPHLSKCMNLASSRRAPARSTNLGKSKQASDAGRSESGADSDASDGRSRKSSVSPLKGRKTDDIEFNLKRKRAGSPQISPPKKSKKVAGSPVSRIKADGDKSGRPNSYAASQQRTASKIPSKLRESSTTSFIDRSSSSRESSTERVSAPPPSAASPFSAQSPSTSRSANGKPMRGRPTAMGTGPPKRPSPAQAQAAPPPRHAPVHVYMDMDEGEETGSSTETDSN